ncbi:MAG: zinc metallopeptidase [Acidobacteriota bacterium]|nr:zinc metallopeptidase [Acidobacteriota bacterium]
MYGYGYGYGYGYDLPYLAIAIISMILGFATQGYINSTYRKWSQVPTSLSGTGADVARRMLDANGASEVGITQVEGRLTDHYDPRDNRLHLSSDNYGRGTVASVAVACHEAGHAVQNATGYGMMRLRTALVPVVNFASQAWGLVFVAGLFLNMLQLMQLAVAFFAVSVLFHLVTLPVEIDASRRAVEYLGTVSAVDQTGAKKVLTAAALTYVAAALTSVMQLMYYAGRTRSRD